MSQCGSAGLQPYAQIADRPLFLERGSAFKRQFPGFEENAIKQQCVQNLPSYAKTISSEISW